MCDHNEGRDNTGHGYECRGCRKERQVSAPYVDQRARYRRNLALARDEAALRRLVAQWTT